MKNTIAISILLILLASCAKDQFSETDHPVFVPSAFSPNADGINDFFKPVISDSIRDKISSYEMKIFSQDKQIIFETTDLEEAWDGRNENGETLPAGDYLYLIGFEIPQEQDFNKVGTIAIYFP